MIILLIPASILLQELLSRLLAAAMHSEMFREAAESVELAAEESRLYLLASVQLVRESA